MESLGTVGIVDKGEYNPESTYYKGNFVLHEGSSWLALKDNLVGVQPEEGENWKYLARGYAAELLSLITAIDSQGLLGDKGAEVASQSLVDKLSDMVANQIVKKAMMSGVQVNDANMVPTSALVYSMQQAITKNAEGLSRLDSDPIFFKGRKETVDDVNEAKLLGGYYISNTSKWANLPPEVKSGSAFILNFGQFANESGGRYCQLLFTDLHGNFYRLNDGSFKDWRTL